MRGGVFMLKETTVYDLQAKTGRKSVENEEIVEKSTLISRNLTIMGRRTSVRLEPEMWDALHDIADREGTSIHSICSLVNLRKVRESSLTAAIRVFLLLYYRAATTEEGHARVRHGDFEMMKLRARVTDQDLSRPNSKKYARAAR